MVYNIPNMQKAESSGYVGIQGAQNAPIKDPGIRDSLVEAMGYLEELDSVMRGQRDVLCGAQPESAQSGGPQPGQPSIEQLARMISQSAACLLSEAKSLRNRL